jgi:general secretion pathway protein F
VNEVLEALDISDAERQIQSQGEHLIDIVAHGGVAQNIPSWLGGGYEKFELTVFSQELLTLLQAGLGLVESIEALNEKEKQPGRKLVFSKILDGLRAGKRFSVVLGEQENIFPPLFLGILRAAEGTGDVPHALSRYIDYQKRIEAVSSKVVSAAIYPAILLLVGGGVSLFLIGYVVPSFADVYQSSSRTMPWMSALLFSLGQFPSTLNCWHWPVWWH